MPSKSKVALDFLTGQFQSKTVSKTYHAFVAVLPPEQAQLPVGATGDWWAAGTGWGSYGSRLPVLTSGEPQVLLPHAQDLLALAAFAWARGEALPADMAQPVYLRDKVATPKAPQ